MTRVLLLGRSGQVGSELARSLASLGEVTATGRAELDLADLDSIRSVVRAAKPDIIVNAAGYTTVDKAESEPDLAMRVNAVAPGMLAEEAKRLRGLLVHYSTDYVYDGTLDRPYTEDDPTKPVNAYGRTKLAGERAIEAVGGRHLILRTSWIYSGRGSNFVLAILKLARERPELAVVADQTGSPTWARALASATTELLRRHVTAPGGAEGIYHLSASGHTSRYEFACAIVRIARNLSGDAGGWAAIRPIPSSEYPLPAERPMRPVTDKSRMKRVFGIEMSPWEDQLRECLLDLARAAPGPLRPIRPAS